MLGNRYWTWLGLFFLGIWAFQIPALKAQTNLTLPEKIAASLRYETVSSNDSAQIDWSQFAAFQHFLQQQFPLFHQKASIDTIGGHSLLFHWRGSNAELMPVMFNFHQDVVPIENTQGSTWTYSPFDGKIADGYIWGRGALDNKGPMIAFFDGVEQLLSEGFQPICDIYVALGHDEELGGGMGARQIAQALLARKVSMAFVLDEGPSVVDGIFDPTNPAVALVGLAEKGQGNIEVKAFGPGGHSSVPPSEMAINRLAAALDRIHQNPMQPRLLPLTLEGMKTLAPLMDKRTQMALKNSGMFKGQIIKALAKEPITDVLIRTKISPTMISGGIKPNVLPREVTAMLNVRILQGDSLSTILAHLKKVIDDPEIQLVLQPNWSEASPITSTKTTQFSHLKATFSEIYPNVKVAPVLMPAGTDSKNYVRLTDNIFRCSPFRISKEDLERIHNNDERIPIATCESMRLFYKSLIQNLPSLWLKS